MDMSNKKSRTDFGLAKLIVTPKAGLGLGGINLGSSLL